MSKLTLHSGEDVGKGAERFIDAWERAERGVGRRGSHRARCRRSPGGLRRNPHRYRVVSPQNRTGKENNLVSHIVIRIQCGLIYCAPRVSLMMQKAVPDTPSSLIYGEN